MSSIIERSWSEEAFRDIRSGIESNAKDSSTALQAEEAFRDIRSGVERNAKDSSTALQGCKSKEAHAADVVPAQSNGKATGDEYHTDIWHVPKGAIISPLYMIICYSCGEEMKNDLMCPRCKREAKGRLLPNVDLYADDMVACCQAYLNKRNDHYGDWEPTSPTSP